jgi:hypothetical protein
MKQKYTTVMVLFLAICVIVPFASAANTIVANPSTISLTQGSTQTVRIMVDDLPYGLSGYHIRVSLGDTSLGKIVSVTYPPWAVLNMTDGLQSASVSMSAVDLTNQVVAGAQGVEIGSISVTGESQGSTNILITVLKLDGDGEAGVDMGRTSVQTTQPTVTATTSAPVTSSGGGGGGSSGGSSAGTSGSSGLVSTITTTASTATVPVPADKSEVVPRSDVVTPSQSFPAEHGTVPAVTITDVPAAVPVSQGGIPGWVLIGIGIIAVLAAVSLIYLTLKKKL